MVAEGATCQTDRIEFGVTLGNDWAGFPVYLAADYHSTNPLSRLDVNLPLYVTRVVANEDSLFGELEDAGYQRPRGGALFFIDPPLPITDPLFQRWFNASVYDRFTLKAAGQGEYPDPWIDPGYETFFETMYTPCAPQHGLEEPQEYGPSGPVFHLTANGELTIKDIHGGNGAETTIFLERRLYGPQPSGCTVPTHIVVLAMGWSQPGELKDWNNTVATRMPEDPNNPGLPGRGPYEDKTLYTWGGGLNHEFVYFHRQVVHWVSTDFASPADRTSPGFVDASDLGVLAAYLGHEVDWGEDYTCPGTCGECTTDFYYNCVPFDLCIDASDLAKLAADMGHPCGLTSKADGFSKGDILAWFGMVQTENNVDVGGGLLYPEIVVVDKEQMERAIADPYGYRNNPIPIYTAASVAPKLVPWSRVKDLYR